MESTTLEPDEGAPLLEVEPNKATPKTLGTLNVVFGCLLMLCGVCTGLNALMQSAMGPMMAAQQQQVNQSLEAERAAQIRAMEEKAKGALDEKEKAQIIAQAKMLQAQPVPKAPDMGKLMAGPGMLGYTIADVCTGLTLNLLMIVSGIGLIGLKGWGRSMALWVAGAKVLRLIGLYGFFIVSVVPTMSMKFVEMFEDMAKSMPQGKQPGQEELSQMATTMGIMMTASAVGMIVLGMIYPIILMVLLNRPRVKAACG